MTYASRLRAEQELQRLGNWPGSKRFVSEAELDKEAELKLTGGYVTKPTVKKGKKVPARNPVCPNCFVAASNSGTCNC